MPESLEQVRRGVRGVNADWDDNGVRVVDGVLDDECSSEVRVPIIWDNAGIVDGNGAVLRGEVGSPGG